MLVRNSKNLAEQEAKRQMVMKLLEVEASNEAILDKRVSSYRNPFKAPEELPPRYRDATEIAQDILGNQLKLVNLFASWGFTNAKANAIVKNIKSNDDVIKILQAQGNLKRRLDSYNKELLSVEFVSNIIEKFLANYDKTMGGNTDDAMEMMLSSWANAKRVFPTREQINSLKSKLSSLKDLKQKAGLNTVSIDSSIESLNKYEKLLPVIENYETLKESGIKSEAVEEMKALLNKGNIPLAININQYITTVNELLEMSRTTRLNRADTDSKLNKIDDSLKYTITPESQAIIMNMRTRLNLPEGATEADVIKEAENERNKLFEENVKRGERINEDQKIMSENYITNAEYLRNYYINAQFMRAFTGSPDWVITGKNTTNIISQYFLDKFRKGLLGDTLEETKEKIRVSLDWVEGEKHRFVDKKKTGGNTKANPRNNPNPIAVDEEIETSIRIEERLNPRALNMEKLNIDKILYGSYDEGNEELERHTMWGEDLQGAMIRDYERMRGRQNDIEYEKQKDLTRDLLEEGMDDEGMDEEYEGKGMLRKLKETLKKGKGVSKNTYLNYERRELPTERRELPTNGLNKFNSRKIKIGKGLELEDEPKFISFGKYLLNKPHLYNDSKLTLRFPSGGAIPTIKPTNVSEDFQEFLIDLIESGKTNEPLYKSVSKEEKLFFQKISKGAGLVHKLGVKQIPDDSDVKDLSRYKLLFGEVEAGNNNKQMINELKGLILKFMNNGRMKRIEGQALLFELSQI